MSNIPKREAVEIHKTWDVTDLFKTQEHFLVELDLLVKESKAFKKAFHGCITTSSNLLKALESYGNIEKRKSQLSTYVSMNLSVESTNILAQENNQRINNALSMVERNTSFLKLEITNMSEDEINVSVKRNPELKPFIQKVYSQKKYMLDQSAEETLASLLPVFKMPRNLYNTTKLVEMKFDNLLVNHKTLPLTYNNYETVWEVESNTKVRRDAFQTFHGTLDTFKHITAKTYEMHVNIEKINADLRGYKDIFEYLLSEQGIEKSMFDRQIDYTMKYLAPHMRKYAMLIKEIHQLDNITFADLKISIDPAYEANIEFEETKKYIYGSLEKLGPEYMEIIKKAYDDRWIDYAENQGKSPGAYCNTPYGSHPFIFTTFTGKMRDVFVLAHEFGHAGHFQLSNQNQNILCATSSEYFFEAPSTMNEMLLANYLLDKSTDLRFRRWVIATIISRTYFHNFVTHLLEAAFQREVYELVDQNVNLTADVLCDIKLNLIKQFWGPDIQINEGAELTWMRQPHYYIGLYPYTYSAGLTIATEASKKIRHEGQPAIDKWLRMLKLGGTMSPIELAKQIDIDITSDKPILHTIEYVGELIDELIDMSRELGDIQ